MLPSLVHVLPSCTARKTAESTDLDIRGYYDPHGYYYTSSDEEDEQDEEDEMGSTEKMLPQQRDPHTDE